MVVMGGDHIITNNITIITLANYYYFFSPRKLKEIHGRIHGTIHIHATGLQAAELTNQLPHVDP